MDADALNDYTDVAVLDLLYEELTSPSDRGLKAADIYDHLRERMGGDYWPEETWAVALDLFGDAMYNRRSRTYQALDRRVSHARRTWRDKFGPLNAEQEAYADTILAHALRAAAKDAGGNRRLLWPYCQASIGRLVNHEDVHAGFKRRAPQLVDVTDTLRELAA